MSLSTAIHDGAGKLLKVFLEAWPTTTGRRSGLRAAEVTASDGRICRLENPRWANPI